MNTSQLTPLGRRIRVGMAASGITSLSELARRVGVSHQTVRRWLYDPAASVDAAHSFRLCDAVRLSARWIVTGDGQPTPRISISPGEARLLHRYRRLPDQQRSILLHVSADLLTTIR